jgi:uroporphyrin-III C-methyltransferase / precorrin-2 dehydrogenase / sirohydrochlorin ferrochelatase
MGKRIRIMRHYPLFMDLKQRRALVVGSGEVAERKAEALRRCGALVDIHPAFDPCALDGCALAVGAEAPEVDLRALSAEARARGIPVNIVDRAELCSFITPSVIDRDPVTVAISSSGTAPVLARMLRSRIEAMIPPAYGRLAALADRFRIELRRHMPDMAIRRRVLEDIFSGRIADLVFANRHSEAAALFADKLGKSDPAPQSGMVYLVGAGPGAADLLTVRAQRLLGEADVIVYDRLVTDDVRDMARRDAVRINVGKARANHRMKQAGISALLVRLCREGKRVVRLKGGDPLVFGRGGEEAEALEEAGVAFEIVPGITAALACAAQARIPLTHRGTARSVTFVTGYTSDGGIEINFQAAVQGGGTLAIYMGIATLSLLRDGLTAAGQDPLTPAALVEWGGTRRQRTLFGTLDELVERAVAWCTGGPVLVLVGPTVGRAGGTSPIWISDRSDRKVPSEVPSLYFGALEPSKI